MNQRPTSRHLGSLPLGEGLPAPVGSLLEHLHRYVDSRAASDSIQDLDHQGTLGLTSALDMEGTSEESAEPAGVRGSVYPSYPTPCWESGRRAVHAEAIPAAHVC